MIKVIQYVELRGDNPLTAVVVGTEANAHLVAGAALARGIDETAEQYHISAAQVYGALAFYHDNQDEIERRYKEVEERSEATAIDGWKRLEELRQRKANKQD
jgi:uncharacterized protein (DUF433 family)